MGDRRPPAHGRVRTTFSPRLIDQTGLHVLDEQERWYRFQVRAGRYLETGGCAILPASWSHVRTRERGAAPVDASV